MARARGFLRVHDQCDPTGLRTSVTRVTGWRDAFRNIRARKCGDFHRRVGRMCGETPQLRAEL